MNKSFEISVLAHGKEPVALGTMPESAITFNRYNKGLLIAAGKISNTDAQQSMYMKFATQFGNTAQFKFQNIDKTYYGEFTFINFDPETFTVVFGSVSPIQEVDTIDDVKNTNAETDTLANIEIMAGEIGPEGDGADSTTS